MVFGDIINWVAFFWFLLLWAGYTVYAKEMAKRRDCLSAVLYGYRIDWIRNVLRHDNRITDMALLGNLTQMISFLATTTILVIAGLVGAVYSTDDIVALLKEYPFIATTTHEQVQFKLFSLLMVFVFAFFKFTWSMRQHSFCSIMLGAAPVVTTDTLTPDEEGFVKMAAKISDRAGHEFNYGLRSYYFALALLTWFISPWAVIPACTAVVVILYRREFGSTTLKYLVLSRESFSRMSPEKNDLLMYKKKSV
jgi:uncharacterized membrane protein